MFGLKHLTKLAVAKNTLLSFQKNSLLNKWKSTVTLPYAFASTLQKIDQQLDQVHTQKVNESDNNVDKTLESYRNALDVLQNLSNTRTLESGEILTMADIHLKKGSIFSSKKDFPKALEHFQKAKTLFINYFGEDPTVAECYDNIGRIHYETGKYNESLLSFFKAAQIYQSYSMELPLTKLYQEINLVYKALGKPEHAFEKGVSGEGFQEKTAEAYLILGEALKREEKYTEAIEAFGEALKVREKLFGRNDERTSECYSLLGRSYSSLGQVGKAAENLQTSIRIKKKVLGKNNIGLVREYIALGDLYCKHEEFVQGLEYYQEALSVNKKNHKTIGTSAAYLHYKIGGIFILLGEFNGAIVQLENSLKAKLKGKEKLNESPYFFELFEMLGVAYSEQKNYRQAKTYYLGALEFCVKEVGETAKEIPRLYISLGSVNSFLKEFEEAEENYKNILQKEIEKHGETHSGLGYIYHGMANAYLRQGKKEQAASNHKKALEFLEKELGPQSNYLAGLYYDAGVAFKENNSVEEGTQAFEKGMDIVINSLGVAHPEMNRFVKVLRYLYKKEGRVESMERLDSFVRVQLN